MICSYFTIPNSSLINLSCIASLGDNPFEKIDYTLPVKSDLTFPSYPLDLSNVLSYMLIC